MTSNPATVEVVGPESSLRGLDEAMTEPISVAGATRPVREVVTIGVADPAVRLRTPQTAEVTVADRCWLVDRTHRPRSRCRSGTWIMDCAAASCRVAWR